MQTVNDKNEVKIRWGVMKNRYFFWYDRTDYGNLRYITRKVRTFGFLCFYIEYERNGKYGLY